MKYNFTFEVGEVNLILQALQEMPHKTVASLVSGIVAASRSQEAANKAAEESAKLAVAAKALESAKAPEASSAEESKAV
jgi:hypothetical protein